MRTPRGRLRATPTTCASAYELCEDLANLLVDQAQTLYHVQAPSEAEILRRMHAGLAGGGADLAPGEAAWVVSRLAELLGWPCPVLPEAGDAPPEHAA